MSEDNKPAEGDTFVCDECSMEILVTKPCLCEDGEPFFTCCGQQMKAA